LAATIEIAAEVPKSLWEAFIFNAENDRDADNMAEVILSQPAPPGALRCQITEPI
jgi:hypothetical protein